MRIAFSPAFADDGGALALFAEQSADGVATLTSGAEAFDRQSGGQLGRALAATRFKGGEGEIVELLAPVGTPASRVVLAGLGRRDALDAGTLERAGGHLVGRLQASGEQRLTVALDGAGALPADAAARLAFGARTRAYRFDLYRTREPAAERPSLGEITVACADPAAAEAAWGRLAPVAEGVEVCRDLLSEPANVLTPAVFADRAEALKVLGVGVETLGEAEMKGLGFGALLGVSMGSALEPKLVLLEWSGLGADPAAPPVVIVGKGLTFDAGGISIKPAEGMETMKWDMGGAGAIFGLFRTLALRRAPVRVVGVCAMCENMVSDRAQRPGDVVKSASGQTIEVIDTDCEGRLVLCDALWYAQERWRPKVVIDLATLTSGVVTALGGEYAGLFSNDDPLSDRLLAAGRETGDQAWRFPMGEAYDKQLASPIADMKNVAGRPGTSIIAAQFLRRFIQPGVAWAHLDISGTAWTDEDRPLAAKGATGFGVRLLDRYLEKHHQPA